MSSDPVTASLRDVLAFLQALASERVAPPDALERLAALRAALPALTIDLVWDTGQADGAVHYDALIRGPSADQTVTLSVSPDGGLPFPLRGAHRWTDRELVRVDGTELGVADAMTALEGLWREARLLERIVDTAIVRRELDRAPIALDEADTQLALDRFRSAHGLLTAADTDAWLRSHGLAPDQLVAIACEALLLERLRHRTVGDAVATRFAASPADFDRIDLVWFEAPSEAAAGDLAGAIAGGADDFLAAADRTVAARGRGSITYGTERRERLGTAAVLTAGAVLPLRLSGRPVVARIRSVTPAVLDDATRQALETALFDGWLAEQRARAVTDWNWGPAEA